MCRGIYLKNLAKKKANVICQISYYVARGFIGGTVSNFKFTQKYFLVGLMTEIVVYTAYPNLYLWLHHRITQKLKQKSKTTFIT